jgi:hypothetical protein
MSPGESDDEATFSPDYQPDLRSGVGLKHAGRNDLAQCSDYWSKLLDRCWNPLLGAGSWDINGNPIELRTAVILVDLLWDDPNNSVDVIVESDTPDLEYGLNGNGQYNGSYTYHFTVDANNDSNLKATQYQGNATAYYVRAVPYNTKLKMYPTAGGGVVYTYKNLGTIN